MPTPRQLALWGVGTLVLAYGAALLTVGLYLAGHPALIPLFHQLVLPWRLVAWQLAHRQSAGGLALLLTAGGSLGWGWHLLPQPSDATSTAYQHAKAAYGSARLRRWHELAPALTVWRVPAVVTTAPAGIVCGRRGRHAVLLTADQHVILVGIPGVGKTRRIILPTIGCLGRAGESLVLTDPKGELYSHTAAWLRDQGYAVVRFDLRDPGRSARWNPLAPLQAAWAANNPAGASKAAWQLAHALVGPGLTQDPLWSQTAEALLAALALAITDVAPPEAQHLHSMYRLLLELGDQLDGYFDGFPDRHPAREAYRTVQSAAAQTRQSIHVSTTAVLRLAADPNIAWLTAAHDAAWPMGRTPAAVLQQLTDQPVALFFVIPDEDSTFYPLVSLAVSQLISTLVEAASAAPAGRLPRRVNFLLDEFGNLPKLPDFDKAINVGRGRGLRFLLAVQSWPQFRAVYGETGAVIANGCAVTLYLGTNDVSTAHEFSTRAGAATITTESQTAQQTTRQATQRAIFTPDELLRWKAGTVLVLQTGEHPFTVPAPDLSAWPWPFTSTADAPGRDLNAAAAALPVFPPPAPVGDDDWELVPLDTRWADAGTP
jgi:type IV secretion system protein VirD4